MSSWQPLVIAVVAALALYAAFVIALIIAGRRRDARALAGFIPDCIALFRRLLRDDRVPRRSKLLLAALIGFLALPIDLVPDFIPIAGQLDDAIIVALVLRSVLRAGGPQLLREYWPGPPSSLNAISRLAYGTPQPEPSAGHSRNVGDDCHPRHGQPPRRNPSPAGQKIAVSTITSARPRPNSRSPTPSARESVK